MKCKNCGYPIFRVDARKTGGMKYFHKEGFNPCKNGRDCREPEPEKGGGKENGKFL